jgi:MFS family permease
MTASLLSRFAYRDLPRSVRALLCVRILNQVGSYTMTFLAVVAGPGQAPAVLSAFGVGCLVSRWAGAWLSSRLALRSVVTLGLAATGAALALLAVVTGPAQIVVAAALVGLAFEIYEPATYEAFARSTDGSMRTRAYGVLSTALVAAGAVSGLLALALLPLGVRWLVGFDAVTCLGAAGVAWRCLSPDQPVASHARSPKRWRPSTPLICLTVAGTAFAVGYLTVAMFVPLVLLQRGAAPWIPGAMLALSAVMAPLLSITFNRFLSRLNNSHAIAAGSAGLAALVVGMSRGQD